MKELIAAIDLDIDTGNWYGALFVGLSLPDVCGKIEYPEQQGSQRRYADWLTDLLPAAIRTELELMPEKQSSYLATTATRFGVHTCMRAATT